MYRVFLGAPSVADLDRDPSSYRWQTVSSYESSIKKPSQSLAQTQPVVFPAATLEAASRRISLIYQNAIFDDSLEGEDLSDFKENEGGVGEEHTTYITWPPTPNKNDGGQGNKTMPSFFKDISKPRHTALLNPFTQFETQETQSYDYSDCSSIVHFPRFSFNLNSLTSIASLSDAGSRKANVLLAVLEVEGPDTIRIKKGQDAGKQVPLLKMILGDEEGAICKLVAWRDVAEAWGGIMENHVAVRRGDVLFIENITLTWNRSSSPNLSASPYLKSKAEICYRAMPITHGDHVLRPDLRLSESDAAVRKVAAVVRWFEHMAGLGDTQAEKYFN